MKVNTTEVRFSLRQYPDLQVISERIAQRPEHGALAREVRRLLRLALLAEDAGLTERDLMAKVRAIDAPATRQSLRRASPNEEGNVALTYRSNYPNQISDEWLDDPKSIEAEESSAAPHLAESTRVTEPLPQTQAVVKVRQVEIPNPTAQGERTASQKGISGFLA